jgi:hypothetical protein
MRLAFLLPVRLHTRFKIVRAARQQRMADEIRVFLERRIEELEIGQAKLAAVTWLRQLLGEASDIQAEYDALPHWRKATMTPRSPAVGARTGRCQGARASLPGDSFDWRTGWWPMTWAFLKQTSSSRPATRTLGTWRRSLAA